MMKPEAPNQPISLPLQTERLLLREFVAEDWRAVHEYATDPEVVRYMPFGPNTEEESKAFVEQVLAVQREVPRTKFELAVALRSNGQFIGGCAIRIGSQSFRDADIGYCFNRGYWGQGYATEAARAAVRFGFEHLGLHRIWATCDVNNAASARVLEKLGMQREGYFRRHMLVRGSWRDHLMYAVLEDEWR